MPVQSGTITVEDRFFCGAVDPDDITADIERSVPLVGRVGSMSFHHVRALYGSALSTSDRRPSPQPVAV